MSRFDGKVVLISGGARGMGETHCRGIVAEGGKVVISDVLDTEGQALADELGDNAVYTHLDVTKEDDWNSAVKLAVDTFGGLNVLINNAGIVNFGTLDSYTEKDWSLIIGINLTGAFLGIKAAAPELVKNETSSIVNISSTAGMQGYAALHGYTASKFGLRGITKSVAMELGSQGVRVNSVHPGGIRTPMTDGLGLDSPGTPINRIGEPEEVTKMVLFLASDDASFSTGSEFIIDGGTLAGEGAVG
ncbi:3alpha(or 20beta)-hydroxysteroid dehydrogenase [Rhodoglobus vestalii]|uniref:3alpha(Or 20beta)-hydroxysteroid dehydrogenase n=1 Tax=Rhodoglobus vestalii TaxID=193384 RepID=A0A8H2K7A4_9MICO|nr:SDR family oxidoreductase [Rhodoglobus vestalii]TQO21163.1 3alpha(or 20beta)-hydroxysteroid dehydrogenase [Rhodoglobus vestalii]